MESIRKNEQKLANQLLKSIDLPWDEYQKRFDGTTPLKLWGTGAGIIESQPQNAEDYSNLFLNSKYDNKPLDPIPNIKFGFKKKLSKEKILQTEYVAVASWVTKFIFKKYIVEIMQKICPDDIQAIPVKVVSLNKNVEPFELDDFYTIKILNCIKAIDEEKSDIEWTEGGRANIRKLYYKENPWQDRVIPIRGPNAPNDTTQYPIYRLDKPCMIAVDALSGAWVWHPKLAKEIPAYYRYFFIKDVELNNLNKLFFKK